MVSGAWSDRLSFCCAALWCTVLLALCNQCFPAFGGRLQLVHSGPHVVPDFAVGWACTTMDLSTSNGKLETDRYGVPQYSGDPEHFEEYVERSWDLFYGRDGQDALQTATPLHLRAQLTGPAYEAVRGLDQKKLRTKDGDGHPLPGGMQLFLDTLKSSIAQETPVRVNELFLAYFYSPNVWRRSSETMAQYIIRRETELKRF